MDWQQELLKRLDLLAEKLGTTGAHLWLVMVRQAKITAIEDLIYGLLFLALTFGGYRLAKFFLAHCEDWDVGGYVGLVLSWIASAIAFLVGIGYLYAAIPEMLNPEFWALQQILDKLK